MPDNEKSALLTPGQREYLRGESDIEDQSPQERAVRARIRERLAQSINDMSLLNGALDPRDVKQAFDTPDIFNQISPSFALIFDGISRASKYDHPENEIDRPGEKTIEMFSSLIEGGLETLYIKRGIEVKKANVDITIEFGDEISKPSETDLNDLSRERLTLLLRAGEISFDEYANALDADLINEFDDE